MHNNFAQESFFYSEMQTLAVVCDFNIECAEDRDEALCATGADSCLCHDSCNLHDLRGPQTGLVLPPETPAIWR